MTNLLGSKRWIVAVGALVVMSGCAAPAQDGGGAASSAGVPSEAAPAEPSASAAPSAAPSASASELPSESPSASASEFPSASPSESPSVSEGPVADAAPSPVPSASPSASAPMPAAVGACTAGQLTGSVQDQLGGGAAGSVYRTLVLTNASDQECVVEGYPGVSFVDAAGSQIGAPAERDGSAAVPVTLGAGASATATLRQTNAQNHGADCELTPATGLRVYPPGATDSLVLPQEIPACSAASIVLMVVGTLQPAT